MIEGPLTLTEISDQISKIFELCFSVKWRDAVPCTDDVVFVAKEDDTIVGFCMVHKQPPYDFLDCPYMYNLCVLPEYRKKGYGTELLKATVAAYPRICTHVDKNAMWLVSRGWKLARKWGQLVEAYHADETSDFYVKHYDPHEHVVYLQ